MKLLNKIEHIINSIEKNGKRWGIYCSTMEEYNSCLDILERLNIKWASGASAVAFKNFYWKEHLKVISLLCVGRIAIRISNESSTFYKIIKFSDLKNIKYIY